MTTIAKADELATLRASLDVERAQNKTLHAELEALRRTIGSAAMLLEQAAAAFTLAGDHEVAVEKLERVALQCRLSLAVGMGAGAECLGRQPWEREAPTQPERAAMTTIDLRLGTITDRDGGRPLCAFCQQRVGTSAGCGNCEHVARQCGLPPPKPDAPDDVHNSHVDALRAVLGEAAERIGRQWEREAPTQPERPPVAPPTEDDEIGRALAEQCTCGGIAGGRACASTCAIFKESHPVCGAEPKQDGSDGPDFRPCTLPRGHEGPHSRNRLMPLHGRPIARREGPRKP